jgi:hypothetical protein
MGNTPSVNGVFHTSIKLRKWDNPHRMHNKDLIERLDRVIQAHGGNYKAVSLRAKLGETAVRDIIVGRVRNPGIYTLEKIAYALDTTIADVMKDAPNEKIMLPIAAYVGLGGEVHPYDESEKHPDAGETECPPGLNPRHVTAIRVKGDSMYPIFQSGWVVYYSKRQDIEIPVLRDGWQVSYNQRTEERLSEFFGKPCIVKLKDGRTMLRTIKRGHKAGRYNLVSYNSPDIDDIEIAWAAKIIFIKT